MEPNLTGALQNAKRGSHKSDITGKPGVYFLYVDNNEKFYIGSAGDLGARWNKHRNKLAAGIHENFDLQRAYNENPKLKFHYLITKDREEAYELEQRWIDKWAAQSKLFNIGIKDVRIAKLGVKTRPETLAKLSAARKGTVLTEEHKAKTSATMKGVKKTAEHVVNIKAYYEKNGYPQHLAEAMSKQRQGDGNPNAKAVSVDGIVYPTGSAAAKALGLKRSVFQRRLESDKPEWAEYQYVK